MKPSVLHLHAGLRKTGSTAIQNYLFEHDVDPRYHYLHAGMANSSLITGQAFRSITPDDPRFAKLDTSETDIRKSRDRARETLKKRLGAVNRPYTILSSETVGILKGAELADLKAFFGEYYEDIRIYIYVRPHKTRMESTFQERLKHQYTDLDRFYPLSFRRTVGDFDDVFGRNRVTVSRFTREDFPGGNIINHFLQQFGIDADVPKHRTDNTSLSLEATQLLFVYRKYYPSEHRRDNERIQCLRQLTGDPLRFHSELYTRLLTSPTKDVDWIEERAGFSLAEDIGAHDNIGIRSEQDLVEIPEQSIRWLRSMQPNLLARMRCTRRNLANIAQAVRRLG